MVKTDKRIENDARRTGPKAKQPGLCANKPAPELELWRGAAEELRHREYASLEQALNAVCDRVIERMALPAAAAEETKVFVYEMLAGDPEMIEAVCKGLRVKR